MLDLTKTAEPKSDQLNADDLVSGPRTLQITGVRLVTGDQPVLIEYAGGEGRPWKPCKSMCRVLMAAWGVDGEQYAGRFVTVYNDPSVKWGGKDVGGIRISHLSHIESKIRMMLTVTRGKRVPYVVEPLEVAAEQKNQLTPELLSQWTSAINSAQNMAQLSELGAQIKAANFDEVAAAQIREIYTNASNVLRSYTE